MTNIDISFFNNYLADSSYHLKCQDSNLIICNTDDTTASKVAVIPCSPEEHLSKDGTVKSYIYAVCYRNGQYLPRILITGQLKKFDLLYQSWGLHKFPQLNRNEQKVVSEVFSTLALHLQPKKTYAFLGGWINDTSLLIKNILITPNQIEFVKNTTVKKEVNLS